jgi:hypothetical protein
VVSAVVVRCVRDRGRRPKFPVFDHIRGAWPPLLPMHTKGAQGAAEPQKKRSSKNKKDKAAEKGKDREVFQDALPLGEESRKRDRGQYEGHDITPWSWAPLADATISSQPAVFPKDSK